MEEDQALVGVVVIGDSSVRGFRGFDGGEEILVEIAGAEDVGIEDAVDEVGGISGGAAGDEAYDYYAVWSGGRGDGGGGGSGGGGGGRGRDSGG